MATQTARRHLPYPTSGDSADVPRDIGNLANAIDDIAFDQQGTAAARPAAASTYPGTYYYATDTGAFSRSVGTGTTSTSWVDINAILPVASLPTSPTAGQTCVFQTSAMATQNVRWTLQYDGTSKWEYLGGGHLHSDVAGPGYSFTDGPNSTSYVALATPGPAVALPLAGDYLVGIGCAMWLASSSGYMSYDIGATGAVDADSIQANAGVEAPSRFQRKNGLSAVTLTSKYKGTGTLANVFMSYRWMDVVPIRVG